MSLSTHHSKDRVRPVKPTCDSLGSSAATFAPQAPEHSLQIPVFSDPVSTPPTIRGYLAVKNPRHGDFSRPTFGETRPTFIDFASLEPQNYGGKVGTDCRT